MSIGANWRQISPGTVSGAADAGANDKFARSHAADQLSGNGEGRSFSDYMFGEDGFDFTDVLDVINPLQHIPGVGMIYRSLTGDELGNGARVVGGGLFGGVFGLAGAAIDAVVDAVTGDDTGSHIMAFVEDSFGGGDVDQGTAIADASDPSTTPGAMAGFDGSYQGELVLPWMAGSQPASTTSLAVSPAEQATIVQSAPTNPVDQTMLASANGVEGNVSQGIKASDLNVPWGRAANAQASVISPQLQAQMQAQPVAAGVAEAGLETDPAELSVAMASAGTASTVSGFSKTVALNSSSGEPVRRASISSEGGNTVWARAQNSGRLSRQPNLMAISSEMAEYESRQAKRTTDSVALQSSQDKLPVEHNQPVSRTGAHSGNSEPPLSAAEMAARFNAALGRDKARTLAAEAVADQGRMTAGQARQNDDLGASRRAHEAVDAGPETHPLMQRASSHIGSDEPVGAWFSQTMMDGLKKYQDMQKQNQSRTSGSAI